MDDTRTPWQLLYDLEHLGEVSDETAKLRLFQEICCLSLTEVLPPQSEDWLRVARAYRLREASSTEIDATRVVAWEYLGGDSCNTTDPRVAAVRAVIGLLYPDDYSSREGELPRVGRFEWLDYFLNFCNSVVDCRDEQSRLLLILFPELTAQPRI